MSEYFSEEAQRLQKESLQAERKHEADLQDQKIKLQGEMTQMVEGQKRQIEKLSLDLQKQKEEFDRQIATQELALRAKEIELKKELGELKADSEFSSTKMMAEVKQEHNRADESIKILKAKLDNIQKMLENQKQKKE